MAHSQDKLLDAALKYTPYGKTVVVTGGTKGIGRAAVLEMAKLKAQVFTCGRSESDLDELLEHCKNEGLNNVLGTVADVSTPEGRRHLVDAVAKAFSGSLDILINNVGTNVSHRNSVEYTDEDFEFLFRTNLQSAFSLTRDFYPLLKVSAPGSCVILNSSVAGGPTAMRSGSLYGMSKAAMNHLVKNLACEWGKEGIRAVSVAPWYTATPLAMRSLQNKEFEEMVLARTPMNRIAQPCEVARTMAFLASPAASYITGVTLPVDGGYSVMGLY